MVRFVRTCIVWSRKNMCPFVEFKLCESTKLKPNEKQNEKGVWSSYKNVGGFAVRELGEGGGAGRTVM